MTHGFEHSLVDDLASPYLFLLFFNLLQAVILILHVRRWFEDDGIDLGSWVRHYVSRLRLHSSILVLFRFLLHMFLLLHMRVW